jgi:acetyl-CoA carboxylase carboxyltransferase component
MSTMKQRVEELEARRELAFVMGGEERIARRRQSGYLTARERISLLLDNDSFHEVGVLATHLGQRPDDPITPADGLVAGFGEIDGRVVAVYAEDATVRGGSTGDINLRKRCRMIDLAMSERIPMVLLLDGAGFRAQEMLERPEGAPLASHLLKLARHSGTAPVVAVVLGPCAGEPALEVALAQYAIMVEGQSMVAAGGPPVVKAAIGVDVSKEELGGAAVHVRISGMIDAAAPDEASAIATARHYLSYLPTNAWSYPPVREAVEPPADSEQNLLDMLPPSNRSAYDMHRVINCIVDSDSWFPIKPDYGKAMITGFARLHGEVVGVLANQPAVRAGAIGAQEADKARKFIDICSAYHVPIVSLVDTPGVMTGPAAEREGSLKHGLAAMYAMAWAQVPVFAVIIRKAFGFGGALMGGYEGGQTLRVAWPTVDFSSLPPESAVQSAHARELEAADDPDALKAELLQRYAMYAGAYPAAGTLNVDDVIDPRETRQRLVLALSLALNRHNEAAAPTRRSGVMP